jgi:hypothetical protein
MISTYYKRIHKYNLELCSLSSEKFKMLNDESDKLEKEFSYLLNPT